MPSRRAVLTRPTVTVKQYGWKRGSNAAISQELSGIDFYLANIDLLFRLIAYKSEPSAYLRRKARAAALAELRVRD
jgi:hypothetical protein